MLSSTPSSSTRRAHVQHRPAACLVLVVAFGLLATFVAAAPETEPAQRVTDFYAGEVRRGAGSSWFGNVVSVGDHAFYSVDDRDTGPTLWRTDGTVQGTKIVADPITSSFYGLRYLKPFGERVVFNAEDGAFSRGTWISDGTAVGTYRLATEPYVEALETATAGNRLFFSSWYGGGLWVTDGTPGSAHQVKDINTTGDENVRYLTAVGSTLFFAANDGAHGLELWKSDGTTNNTVLVKDITPGATSSFDATNVQPWLIAGNERLFFAKQQADCYQCRELWSSDGTEAGTHSIAQGLLHDAVAYNGDLYFLGTLNTPIQGSGLWRSDGTVPGTVLVAKAGLDFPAFPSNTNLYHNNLQVAGSWLFFTDTDGRLWKTNGTKTGLQRVKDIAPIYLTQGYIAETETAFFFLASSSTGVALWRADKGFVETLLVREFPTAEQSNYDLWQLAAVGNRVLITASNNRLPGMWVSDGTAAGTYQLVNPPMYYSGIDDSYGNALRSVGEHLFFNVFQTSDGYVTNGNQLWTSDGTAEGTKLVRNVNPEYNTWSNLPFRVQGKTVFWGTTQQGVALFQTDGTFQGTKPIKQMPVDAEIVRAIIANDTLFFFSLDSQGTALWKSDGTQQGTVLIKRVHSEKQPVPSDIVAVGRRIFFKAFDATHGYELWTSDGTASGTHLVIDFDPGPYDSTLSLLTAMHNTLFFVREHDFTGAFELWKSDGSESGTVKITDIPYYDDQIYDVKRGPKRMTVVGNTLFFTVNSSGEGYDLWKSDGTAGGTGLVKDMSFNHLDLGPSMFTAFRNVLLFKAYHPAYGYELWRSDGTPEGTYLLKDIHRGVPDSGFNALTSLSNGRAVFAASDGVSNVELWATDGTTAGTWMVQDIARGAYASYPRAFTESGDQLFFFANDGETGRELWKLPMDALLTPPTPTVTMSPTQTPTATSTPSAVPTQLPIDPSQRRYIPLVHG